jgi:hypothetical protein
MAYVSKVQFSEADDDWLRASRLKREGKLDELAKMESSKLVPLDITPTEYEEDLEEE